MAISPGRATTAARFSSSCSSTAEPYGVRDGWRFDWEAQLLAEYGYAVLQVNYRGSGGYGEDFMRAGYREWGGKMQDDLTDATRWAIASGIAAPDGICIFGTGYGGYAALMGVVREPELYQCAAAYDGLYDLELALARDDPKVTIAGRAYLDEIFGRDEQALRARSPVANVDRINASAGHGRGHASRRVPARQVA